MLEYKVQKPLSKFSGMPLMPKNHWSNVTSWVMVEFMYNKIVRKLKDVIVASNYLDCNHNQTS
jgi:hypothetical protein